METGGTPVLWTILTEAERAALVECETIIRQGRAMFVHVGNALSRIRESRLYREKYATFEEYCLVEWEISDRYSRNLRSATDVVCALMGKNFAVLPATESQARPLTKLPREEWTEAWREVLADGQRVTASRVAEVVQRRINRMAGVSTDTEIVTKSAGEHRTSNEGNFVEAGTREERILAAAASAQAKLRELQDLIRTEDGDAAAKVVVAIRFMDDLQDHTQRVRELHASRSATGQYEQKETEGAKL